MVRMCCLLSLCSVRRDHPGEEEKTVITYHHETSPVDLKVHYAAFYRPVNKEANSELT